MNNSKRKINYKQALKPLLIFNLFLLLSSLIYLAQAIPVGSGVRFYTGSGYFTFPNLLTANSVIYMNGGWNLTSVQLTGDDETLSYAWINISTGHMTITHLVYKKQFTATVTAPSGTVVTIQLKLSKWTDTTPKSIKINNVYYDAMAHSMQEFNSAQYTTWYWKSGILYLKVKTSSSVPITVDWAQAPPSPAPPSPPSPPSPVIPTPPSPPEGVIEAIKAMISQLIDQICQMLLTLPITTWIIIAIAIIIIIVIIKSRD